MTQLPLTSTASTFGQRLGARRGILSKGESAQVMLISGRLSGTTKTGEKRCDPRNMFTALAAPGAPAARVRGYRAALVCQGLEQIQPLA